MAFIPYVTYEEASDRLKAIYDKMGGLDKAPANIIRISSVKPPVMEGHVALFRSIMTTKSPLTRAQKEMIAVVVSGINQCHY